MPIFKVSRRIAISTKRFAIAIFSCSLIIFFSQTAVNTFTVPLRSQKGMVVSAHPLASDAGIKMLRQCGNAVDAAVATTFAISVVEPFSAGIGGGGFLLMHSGKTGEIKALDFRERAPLKATKDMYLDADGKMTTSSVIKKKQYCTAKNGSASFVQMAGFGMYPGVNELAYYGISVLESNDNIYILYNDNPKNEERVKADKNPKSVRQRTSVTTLVTCTPDGKVSGDVLFKSKDSSEGIAMPLMPR